MYSQLLSLHYLEEHHSVLQTSSQREFAQHKAIYGISVDPNNVYQLASYAEVKEEEEREGGREGRGREGRVVEDYNCTCTL